MLALGVLALYVLALSPLGQRKPQAKAHGEHIWDARQAEIHRNTSQKHCSGCHRSVAKCDFHTNGYQMYW